MSYGKSYPELPAGIPLATGHKFAVYQNGFVRQVDASALGASPAGSSGQLQYNASGSFAAMTSTLWDETNGSLSIFGKTTTTLSPAIYLSQTWNNVATPFMLLRLNIVDSASAASSSFIKCSVSASTVFDVRKDGTITFGAWQGTAIGATYGGTGQTTWTTGDLLYASGTNTVARRAIGAENQIFTAISGTPQWAYPGMAINTQNADYTLALTDGGGAVYRGPADTTDRAWQIPNNGSVAFPVKSVITFINDSGTGNVNISINTDTLVLIGTGSTGPRVLGPWGIATAMKVGATRWLINGTNLT